MALTVIQGQIAAPGSTGDQTITLPAGSNPKAIIVRAGYQLAPGQTSGPGRFSLGFGTFDGGVVQQGYIAVSTINGTATVATVGGVNSTALLKGLAAAGSSVSTDWELDLVSMSDTSVVLNWVSVPALGAAILDYTIIGGSDVTRAVAGQSTTAVSATWDITVASGAGKPDLVLFAGRQNPATLGDVADDSSIVFGVGIDDTQQQMSMFHTNDGGATAEYRHYQVDGMFAETSASAVTYTSSLAAKASWPTNGFRITSDATPPDAKQTIWLALYGTFDKSVGTVQTSTGADVDYDAGFTPAGALLWGGNQPNSASIIVSDPALGAWGIGGYDGTNQSFQAWANKDGQAANNNGQSLSTDHAWQSIEPTAASTPALAGEATASIVGTAVRFTWSDPDTEAREFNILVLGAGIPPLPPPPGSIGRGTIGSGTIGFPGGAPGLQPTGIPSAESFGSATIQKRKTLTLTGIASAQAFGTARVSRRVALSGLASAESFGTLTARQIRSLSPGGIASAEAFGTPLANHGQNILLNPGFEGDISDWVVSNNPSGNVVSSNAVRSTAWAENGAAALRYTATRDAGTGNTDMGVATTQRYPVDPSHTEILRFVVNLNSAPSGGMVVQLAWINAAGAGVSNSNFFFTGLAAGRYVLTASADPPATATRVFPVIRVRSNQANEVVSFDIDDVFLGFGARVVFSGIASAEAFGTANVHPPVPQTATLAGVASAEAFGSPTLRSVRVGAPTGIPSAEAFGTPAVTLRKTVTTAGISSAESFGTSAVKGRITLAGSGIASTQAFGALTFRSIRAIAPTGIGSAEAFGTIKVNRTTKLAGISSSEAFGTARITRTVKLSGIASQEAFGTSRLALRTSLASIASAEAFGTVSITKIKAFAPAGIPSSEAFGTARVNRTLPLSGIGTSEAFGTARVSRSVFVQGIASAESFGAITVTSRYAVSTAGIPSAEDFGTAVELRRSNTLGMAAVPSAEEFGTLTRTGLLVIFTTGIPSEEAFGFEFIGAHIIIRRAVGRTDILVTEPATAVVDRPVVSTGAVVREPIADVSIREPLEDYVELLTTSDAVITEPKEDIVHNVDSVTAVVDLHAAPTDVKEQ